MIVLFVAAPPCPDFSKIRDDAPGSAGPEGQKFTQYCAFVNKIEEQIPHKRVGHLVENVLMAKGEADHFSSRLDCQAVACDSADLGLINRPRLWWSRINWSKIRSSPWTGHRLKWGKAQKFHTESMTMDPVKMHLNLTWVSSRSITPSRTNQPGYHA